MFLCTFSSVFPIFIYIFVRCLRGREEYTVIRRRGTGLEGVLKTGRTLLKTSNEKRRGRRNSNKCLVRKPSRIG